MLGPNARAKLDSISALLSCPTSLCYPQLPRIAIHEAGSVRSLLVVRQNFEDITIHHRTMNAVRSSILDWPRWLALFIASFLQGTGDFLSRQADESKEHERQ